MVQKNIIVWVVIIGAIALLFFSPGKLKLELGSVLPLGEYRSNSDCTFITNVPGGGTYKQGGAWISVDKGSGMDGYIYTGYSSYSCTEASATMLSIKTPEGYDLCTRSGYDTRVYLRQGNDGIIFDSAKSGAENAVLTCDGVTPPPNGGTSTCSIEADTSGDGIIGRTELGVIIQLWSQS